MLEGHSEALLVVQDQYQQLAKENTQELPYLIHLWHYVSIQG